MTGNSRFAVCVHVLAYLAFRKGAPVSSAEMAASVDTNPVVIRRLLSALVKAKLVIAHKGATGGFTLATEPARITLREIYQAIEPHPTQGLKRFAPNRRCPVGARIEEILHDVFGRAQSAMEAELARVTLDAVERQLHSVCTAKK